MSSPIDIAFDVYSDTPRGKDPDTYSPTLRRYHMILWSKPLPDGRRFDLNISTPGSYLHHQSELGSFRLSSDSIGHSYRYVKSMTPIIELVPPEEINAFFSICSTIGGYIVFPGNKVDNKMTINASRGMDRRIGDRFDLTLECIRRHYANLDSPLSKTLQRYADFFKLFQSFRHYVDFFYVQDLVSKDYATVDYYLPCSEFQGSQFPKDLDEYRTYRNKVTAFISRRNQRIAGL